MLELTHVYIYTYIVNTLHGWMDGWIGGGWLPWSCVGLKSFCLCTHLDRLLKRQ
jgi:hypothetical protein